MPVLSIVSKQKCFFQDKFHRGARYMTEFFLGHIFLGGVVGEPGRQLAGRLQLPVSPRSEQIGFNVFTLMKLSTEGIWVQHYTNWALGSQWSETQEEFKVKSERRWGQKVTLQILDRGWWEAGHGSTVCILTDWLFSLCMNHLSPWSVTLRTCLMFLAFLMGLAVSIFSYYCFSRLWALFLIKCCWNISRLMDMLKSSWFLTAE